MFSVENECQWLRYQWSPQKFCFLKKSSCVHSVVTDQLWTLPQQIFTKLRTLQRSEQPQGVKLFEKLSKSDPKVFLEGLNWTQNDPSGAPKAPPETSRELPGTPGSSPGAHR